REAHVAVRVLRQPRERGDQRLLTRGAEPRQRVDRGGAGGGVLVEEARSPGVDPRALVDGLHRRRGLVHQGRRRVATASAQEQRRRETERSAPHRTTFSHSTGGGGSLTWSGHGVSAGEASPRRWTTRTSTRGVGPGSFPAGSNQAPKVRVSPGASRRSSCGPP